MEELVQVKNLKKYFPIKKGFFEKVVGHVKAVDDVSFSIRKGETFGLVGESGCGKTTVGKLLLRLHHATGGEVMIDGCDILALDKKALRAKRSEMQIIFQDPFGSLNPKMSVGKIIAEGIIKHKILPRTKIDERVRELLEIVGLHADDRYKYPHEFSGGQRQRIVIARALSFNPKTIVCDEPVSALDVSVQAQVLNLLKDLQEKLGVTYLFIAHGMAAVKHISDRIGVMYLGKIVEIANTHDIFNNAAHPYTKALMSSVPVPDPDIKKNQIILEGEVPNPINPPKGCKFNPRCVYAKDICRSEEPVLRNVDDEHQVACHFPIHKQ